MVQVLRETIKVTLLILFIVWSVLVITDPSPARALHLKVDKIYKEKSSLHKGLTREERDRYMEYLRTVNGYPNDSLFTEELP
tara:strand:- start:916 stop:1161 length:246 start_codon:yes stop_codon:yes gene_type:complete